MAKSNVRDVVVDPHFFIPTGLIDVRQENREEGESYYDESTIAEEGPTLETPTSNIPMPPSSYTIAEQKVRISPNGTSVVDVYIEFPDSDGLYKIDVDVTKA